MNPLAEISWKYYDHIRLQLKEVKPSAKGLIDHCHHKHNKFIANNFITIGENVIKFSIRPVNQGFMLLIMCETNQPSFNTPPIFFSFIESDRSVLFVSFKEAIDEIFKQRILQ